MIYVIVIKHAKFSDSSNEPQLLPCAPACGYKIHALAVYLHLTFTTTFQLEVIWNPIEHLRWSFYVEIVNVFSLLAIFAKELHCRCFKEF